MTRITKITTAALIASTVLASQAQAASRSVYAGATIIKPLTLTAVQPMNFGTFASGLTAGTIDHFGATTGGVVYQRGAQPAILRVSGEPNTNFSISTSPTAILTKTGGTETMTASIAVPSASVLDAAGLKEFNATGTLSVAANQKSGLYEGGYTVTVSY